MTKYIYICILTFIYYRCSLKRSNVEYYDKLVEIKTISKQLRVPISNNVNYSDTLKFEITNKSDFIFLFAFNEKNAYFCSPNRFEDENHVISDPNDGILLSFYDENFYPIITRCESSFNPDLPADFYDKKKIKKLQPHSKLVFNLIISFPSVIHDQCNQTVEHVDQVAKVMFLFEPDITFLEILMKENKLKFMKNERALKTRIKIAGLPVKVI